MSLPAGGEMISVLMSENPQEVRAADHSRGVWSHLVTALASRRVPVGWTPAGDAVRAVCPG